MRPTRFFGCVRRACDPDGLPLTPRGVLIWGRESAGHGECSPWRLGTLVGTLSPVGVVHGRSPRAVEGWRHMFVDRDERPLGRSPWRTVVPAGVVLFLTLTVGCAPTAPDERSPTPDPALPTGTPAEGTLLPEGTSDIELTVGETVQVRLPDGSVGVGDHWGVLDTSDPSVVRADVAIGSSVIGSQPNRSDGGTEPVQQFAIEVTGLEPGTSTVTVLYCTRTREVSKDCDQSQGTLEGPVEPVELSVTVR